MSARMQLPLSQRRHTNVAVVRYTKHGVKLEIACYKNKVISFRSGVETRLDEVLQVERVFSNVSKGLVAPEKDIVKVFGKKMTENEAIKYILLHGDVQVAQHERSAEVDEMFIDIALMISHRCVNVNTNRPFPSQVIEQALRSIGVGIKLDQPIKKQALALMHQLIESKILPLARAKMKLRCNTTSKEGVDTILQWCALHNAEVLEVQDNVTSVSHDDNKDISHVSETMLSSAPNSHHSEHSKEMEEYEEQDDEKDEQEKESHSTAVSAHETINTVAEASNDQKDPNIAKQFHLQRANFIRPTPFSVLLIAEPHLLRELDKFVKSNLPPGSTLHTVETAVMELGETEVGIHREINKVKTVNHNNNKSEKVIGLQDDTNKTIYTNSSDFIEAANSSGIVSSESQSATKSISSCAIPPASHATSISLTTNHLHKTSDTISSSNDNWTGQSRKSETNTLHSNEINKKIAALSLTKSENNKKRLSKAERKRLKYGRKDDSDSEINSNVCIVANDAKQKAKLKNNDNDDDNEKHEDDDEDDEREVVDGDEDEGKTRVELITELQKLGLDPKKDLQELEEQQQNVKRANKKGNNNKDLKTISLTLDDSDDDDKRRGGKRGKQKGNKRRKGNVNNAAVVKSSTTQEDNNNKKEEEEINSDEEVEVNRRQRKQAQHKKELVAHKQNDYDDEEEFDYGEDEEEEAEAEAEVGVENIEGVIDNDNSKENENNKVGKMQITN